MSNIKGQECGRILTDFHFVASMMSRVYS